MQLDWITVSAQIVNFLILVWLLKRFLYQPVIDIMARREALITNRLEQANTLKRKADEKQLHYDQQRAQLDRERDEILGDARVRAEQETLQLMEQARHAVSESRAHWQQQTNKEKAKFLTHLQRNAVDTIEAISRKALTDLADAELEERIIDVFISRLKALDNASRQALSATPGPIYILTSFELGASIRSRLTRAIHEYISKELEIDYGTSDGLICGITLTAGGRRLAWNVADYLAQLYDRIDDAFNTIRAPE